MKAFREFLQEKFFATYEGHGRMGVTEVWVNPTLDEIAEASGNRRWMVTRSFKNIPETNAFRARGWLTPKQLFIWDDESDNHMDVEAAVVQTAKEKGIRNIDFSQALALELFYWPEERLLGIHMASWSNPHRYTDEYAAKIATNHPAIKPLKITIHPMD